ncbi:restriction endonuclease subunit S [Nocardia salmonicida]|uniref:restriction endonuclease subunit S n=1 Tax=Nocardia salmonicida TaxID=53431 RepID=UPI0033DB55D4
MSLNLDKSTWKRVAFGDVVRNVNETVRDPAAAGIERVIAMEHMEPGELKIQRWGSTAEGTTFTRRVKPGQTLFGKRRAYQRKVAHAEFDAICSGDILTFEADEAEMRPEFLPFLAQSSRFFEHALGTSAGSLSPRTNWRDLASFEFDLPPLDEQKRLSVLLSAVERHAQQLNARSEHATVARSMWLDIQVESLIARSAIPFEKSWSRSPESGWSSKPLDEATGTYVLSLAALGPTGYRPGNLKNIAETPQSRSATLRLGDLLISRANTVETVGRIGIYSEDRDDVSFPDTMMRLSLTEEFSPEFAAAVLSSAHGRAHMRRTAAGSATSMVKINRKSLGQMLFPVAAPDEQNSLLQQLDRFDGALESSTAELLAIDVLKSSLLDSVFGGE